MRQTCPSRANRADTTLNSSFGEGRPGLQGTPCRFAGPYQRHLVAHHWLMYDAVLAFRNSPLAVSSSFRKRVSRCCLEVGQVGLPRTTETRQSRSNPRATSLEVRVAMWLDVLERVGGDVSMTPLVPLRRLLGGAAHGGNQTLSPLSEAHLEERKSAAVADVRESLAAAEPDSSRACNVDVARLMACELGREIGDAPTKAAVMGAIRAQGRGAPRFSKYVGIVEWRNAIVLWVNIGGSDYDNQFFAEKNESSSMMMTWYAGSRMHRDTPVIRRLMLAVNRKNKKKKKTTKTKTKTKEEDTESRQSRSRDDRDDRDDAAGNPNEGSASAAGPRAGLPKEEPKEEPTEEPTAEMTAEMTEVAEAAEMDEETPILLFCRSAEGTGFSRYVFCGRLQPRRGANELSDFCDLNAQPMRFVWELADWPVVSRTNGTEPSRMLEMLRNSGFSF